ncbi:MAG: hypothetical protein J5729_02940 [Bacteroidaceae bacterium]|nr:hypothetical protein [Bacteroidaceae bacterium]
MGILKSIFVVLLVIVCIVVVLFLLIAGQYKTPVCGTPIILKKKWKQQHQGQKEMQGREPSSTHEDAESAQESEDRYPADCV